MVKDGTPDINQILAQASIIGIEKISARMLSKIKSTWLKHKYYGFSPTPSESEALKEISNNSTYNTFSRCVGKYEFNAFIRIGLLLYELNEKGDTTRVNEIRKYVYSKHGSFPKKIIHIASTGVLLPVLEYLTNLKDEKNLSSDIVREEFANIVSTWENVSIAVSILDPESLTKEAITKKVLGNVPIFFVYAAGNAVNKSVTIVAELRNGGLFSGKYLPWCKVRHLGKVNPVEYFLGVFYAVDTAYDTHLSK